MIYIRRKGWELSENRVTPEHVFLNRRAFMATSIAAGIAGVGGNARAAADPRAAMYPAPLNATFKDAGRAITDETAATTFNNFYEFGASKRISEAAKALVTTPWAIQIDGEVDAPMTIDFDDLMKKVKLEERIIRHRCVEAWAMVVPWSGFPLKQLVEIAAPKNDAKYVRFETFNNPEVAPGQKMASSPVILGPTSRD
jgi:methionine sulfoxide reductase catalytic subunit